MSVTKSADNSSRSRIQIDKLRWLPQPGGHATRSEALAREMETLILRGDLADGEQLPTEPELCEALGVSRSVVRDAVRMLVARGLLKVRQGAGTVVTAPSDAAFGDALISLLMRADLTVGDVIEARAALETELAPLAAERGTKSDWLELGRRLEAFRSAVEAGEWRRAHLEHTQFHLGIFRALQMSALELILAPMQQCILITSLPPSSGDSGVWEVDKHPPILAALRARDGDAARSAMEDHFSEMGSSPAYRAFRETPFRSETQLQAYRSFRNQPPATALGPDGAD